MNNRDDRRDTVNGGTNDSASKRAAPAGQWRTPPLPAFFPSYGQQPAAQPQVTKQQHTHAPPDQGLKIPGNSEEYAKALQDAYRKGAEAAQRIAHQQHINIPTTNSCPNFSTGSKAASQISPMAVVSEETAYSHKVHPTSTLSAIPDPLSSSMPPPPPASVSHAPIHPQHHQPQPVSHSQHHDYSASTKPVAPANTKSGRSVSLPDMSAFAAQAEEEKRQKRLARNRASARLRRLRKKNLVSFFQR